MFHGIATWDTTFSLVDLMLDAIRADIDGLRADMGDLGTDLGDLGTGMGGQFGNVATLIQGLRTDLSSLQNDARGLRTDVNTLRTDVNARALQTTVTALTTRVSTLESSVSTLQTDVNNLKALGEPMTFAWSGTPVVGSMINMPIIYNMSIPAFPNQSRYYNATAPLVASVFTLTVQPAGTAIGYVDVNTSGVGTFRGSGSNTLVPGNVLRMTATTIGGSLTNPAMTIQTSRR